MSIVYRWRGHFEDAEVNALHAEAFDAGHHTDEEWDWLSLVGRHSLGWATARNEDQLVGFMNVIWDGRLHAWIQDVMVSALSRHQGTGTRLIALAREECKKAGCEWLHVDFDDDLGDFYFRACGFTPTSAGLIRLK